MMSLFHSESNLADFILADRRPILPIRQYKLSTNISSYTVIILHTAADQDGTDESRHGEEHGGDVEDSADNENHDGHYHVVVGHEGRRDGVHHTWLHVGRHGLLDLDGNN